MRKADDLYVMCNSLLPALYKVGRAADPQKRANQLMASQPFRIKVLITFPEFGFLEKAVHRSLEAFRVKTGPGIEWFQCDLSHIVSTVLARLPTYFSQLLAEKGRHAVEGMQAHGVAFSDHSSDLAGSSLGGHWVSSVLHPGTRAALATEGFGSPGEVVPDGRELPVFGEVEVGVLTVGQIAAMEALDNLSFREEASSNVLECPESWLEESDELERLSNETVGPF